MTDTSSSSDSLGPLDEYLEIVHEILDRAAHILIAQLPIIQEMTMHAIDSIFIPKVMARQLMIMMAIETGLITVNQISSLLQWVFVSTFSSRHRLVKQLEFQQKFIVSSQDEWMDIAERIDTIQGNDLWRSDPSCPLYERERIQARIDEYVHLMRRRDIFELMFLLRGSIGRNKFGLLHEGLFTKALAGSKVLTETYHNVVCAALDFVCDAPVLPEDAPIPTDARLAFFNETRHAYGRTALLLSGGAALGFYHVGLVKALMENGLMPRVIGGSSAGSIVCAMIGTRTDQECLHDLFEVKGTVAPGHSGRLSMNFFRPLQTGNDMAHRQQKEDDERARRRDENVGGLLQVYYNTAGAFHDMKRTIQGFMPIPVRHVTSFIYDLFTGNRRPKDVFKNDTAHFRDCVRANVGDFTFQEAFDRTGRILNIVVTPNNSSDPPRLLNYLTAPHVMVWSAAVASSSLPGVFEANRLVVKEADGWERYESSGHGTAGQVVFSDGSMEQDLPMQQLSEMFNINHFIISQANPHAVMFASYTQKMSVWANPITGLVYQVLTFMRNQLRSWLLNLVQCVGARRITPLFETQRGIGTQFFTQEYEGRSTDISLVPWLGHRSLFSALLHIIYNPSEAEFREWIQASERETWRYIPAIKSHIAEEVTLDRCVQRLRRRLLHESFEKQQQSALQYANHLHPQAVQNQLQSNNNNNNNRPPVIDEMKQQEGRVPSFFTSHSLVNLSGLSIGDRHEYANDLHQSLLHDYAMPIERVVSPPPISAVAVNPEVIGQGWAGMGLSGNRRSSGNLLRNLSDASGLFIDDPQSQQNTDVAPSSTEKQQVAGESTSTTENVSTTIPTTTSNNNSTSQNTINTMVTATSAVSLTNPRPSDNSSYVKTSSMARFYYRKAPAVQGDDYLQLSRRSRTNSLSALGDGDTESTNEDRNSSGHHRLSMNITNNDNNTPRSNSNVARPPAFSQHNRSKSRSYNDLERSW